MNWDVLDTFWQAAWPKLFDFGKTLLMALLIWIIGKKLIKMTTRIVKRAFDKASIDDGVETFLLSMIRILLYGVLIVVLAGTVGVETGSIIALLGSAGLAIGLALQGSLSNFAGGVLILILKPFRIGDYIVANGMEGTVIGIEIFYTRLRTGDNRIVVLPNGNLSNSDLINVSHEDTRRLDVTISVDYESDLPKVKTILFDIGSKLEYSLKDEEHPITSFISNYGASGIDVVLRFWVKSENYWDAKWTVNDRLKEVFDKEGIVIPYNQLDVTIKNK